MEITNHAVERAVKRIGINKKAVDKMKNTAIEKGLKHSESNGRLKKYYDSLFFRNKVASNIRMYANFVWIFDSEKLITVFPIPQNLIKIVNKSIKKTTA